MSYSGPYLFWDQDPNATVVERTMWTTPYDHVQRGFSAYVALVHTVGLFSNSLMIICFLTMGKDMRTQANYLVLSMTLADLLNNLGNVWTFWINTMAGRFAAGRVACQVVGFSDFTFGGISISMCAAIAFERFTTVVRGKPLGKGPLAAIIGSVWLGWVIWGTSFWWFHHLFGYPMRSSGFMCLVHWADKEVQGKVSTAFTTLYIVACVVIITYSYYHILRKTFKVFGAFTFQPDSWSEDSEPSSLKKSPSVKPKSDVHKKSRDEHKRLERQVTMRSLIMVAVFLIEWIPYCFMIFIELVTSRQAAPLLDLIAASITYLNWPCNSIIAMTLDKRFNKRAKELLCIDKLFHSKEATMENSEAGTYASGNGTTSADV